MKHYHSNTTHVANWTTKMKYSFEMKNYTENGFSLQDEQNSAMLLKYPFHRIEKPKALQRFLNISGCGSHEQPGMWNYNWYFTSLMIFNLNLHYFSLLQMNPASCCTSSSNYHSIWTIQCCRILVLISVCVNQWKISSISSKQGWAQ